MSKQSDAIREYFDKNGILQREIAEKLGVHEGTVSSILSGRFGISKNTARKLADIYGFDLGFLLSGEGSLFPPGVRIHQSQRVSGGTGIQTVGADQALQGLAAGLGLPKISMYWARHTLASLLIETGATMEVAAGVLGHSYGPRVTAGYVTLRERQIEEAVRKVYDLVAG